MELLERPYWNIMDKQREELLKVIAPLVRYENFYLRGGTALSLQLGLRKSFDFDFFTPDSFSALALYGVLNEAFREHDLSVININSNTCDLHIDGVQVSFFQYPYPLIYQPVEVSDVPFLKLANPEDIAAMKVSAIGGRGAKKDFYDLYQIMNIYDISAQELAECVVSKFGKDRNYTHMCMGLSYFEDAESEKLPETFVKYDWKQIKKYFSKIQDEFATSVQENISAAEPKKLSSENQQRRNIEEDLEL